MPALVDIALQFCKGSTADELRAWLQALCYYEHSKWKEKRLVQRLKK